MDITYVSLKLKSCREKSLLCFDWPSTVKAKSKMYIKQLATTVGNNIVSKCKIAKYGHMIDSALVYIKAAITMVESKLSYILSIHTNHILVCISYIYIYECMNE